MKNTTEKLYYKISFNLFLVLIIIILTLKLSRYLAIETYNYIVPIEIKLSVFKVAMEKIYGIKVDD